MTQDEFIADAEACVEQLCFCDQLGDYIKSLGSVCHWCKRLKGVLDGTIKNLVFTPRETGETK